LLWGNWFPCFFCVPVIVLGVVTLLVLCAIKYFLACNNNNGNIYNGRLRGGGKQEIKENGKTNKQKSRKKQKEESNKNVSKF
jgi:hypothetical protein